jgi:hypothetical protein
MIRAAPLNPRTCMSTPIEPSSEPMQEIYLKDLQPRTAYLVRLCPLPKFFRHVAHLPQRVDFPLEWLMAQNVSSISRQLPLLIPQRQQKSTLSVIRRDYVQMTARRCLCGGGRMADSR